jgi:hypothetical protein
LTRAARATACALATSLACRSTDVQTAPAPPFNSCPENACSAYVQGGATPTCIAGACVVSQIFDSTVLISIPETAYIGPGLTYVASFSQLLSNHCAGQTQSIPCVKLDAGFGVQGYYSMYPSAQAPSEANWYLGNPGTQTVLPIHVTYRALWPPGAPTDYASAFGLPIPDVVVDPVTNLRSEFKGPNGGTPVAFQGYVLGGEYERVIQPDSPFDVAFPPDIQRVTISTSQPPPSFDRDQVQGFEKTSFIDAQLSIPSFNIQREGGSLGGWHAW